ncbi:rac GTPase-activating protein 1 [Neodiprion pinetum]|uniref:Rac GTPase-activating protein 1 n=1 Tax=Neodiprion lecontei TaxID=441921 RepID=A0A6J0C831_NEOLC|nr:rac GTPase-activating protein 1 [Neodiprion lecontei]XP_046476322.1 rac GTPase-activating protein 1 [Neodiprion pinetum]XP_046476324.1 rac GTPase-activating protein 1 [Neodiprion pinetum]XP_046592537.1 rac GTPase-activating protein 1 [Neodiprion lecontei]
MTTSLSILASHDELVRCTNVLVNGSCEEEFLRFAINQEEMRQKWLASVQECQRLHSALEKSHLESADLERKLSHARRLLDEEKRRRRIVEDQRNSLERQISMVRDLFLHDGGRNLNDETREKLQFLNNTTLNNRSSNVHLKDLHHADKLNTIAELDSTGSLLSDLSCFSKSEDDLDASVMLQQNQKKREWKEHRPSGEYSTKKRRSSIQKAVDLNTSDRIVATTTVVLPKDGPITASSVIEAKPGNENEDPNTQIKQSPHKYRTSADRSRQKSSHMDAKNPLMDVEPSAPKADIMTSGSDSEGVFKPSPNIGGYTLNIKSSRGHTFTAKTVIKPEVCTPCGKRIRFGRVALKCRECRATSHAECKDLVPLPCVPAGNTPTLRGISGTIADYTPMIPPMVPSLVVHCINEVELRGMGEQGLYRVNGGSSDVKCLKDKFLKGKGAPNLSDIDIPTICSTLKDFLRTLREPLITVGLWADFARATAISDKQDADAALYQAISELPQPNRDTLAFLILHLQRVSSSPECKMPITNLAKVFGPTLVGYSCQEPSPNSMLSETKSQVAIVESLLKIPSDYWANFVNSEGLNGVGTPKTGELRHTPSTESLLKRTASRGFFNTPISSSRTFMRKNKKYFATPPSKSGY